MEGSELKCKQWSHVIDIPSKSDKLYISTDTEERLDLKMDTYYVVSFIVTAWLMVVSFLVALFVAEFSPMVTTKIEGPSRNFCHPGLLYCTHVVPTTMEMCSVSQLQFLK